MSHIVFTDQTTVVPASWLNDVDRFVNAGSLSSPVFGTNLAPGPDTGRFGADGLRFRNTVTNSNSYLTLMPNGTGPETGFRLYNQSDPTGVNTAALTIRLTGASAFIEPVAFGTGTLPTSLGIVMNTTVTGILTATTSVIAPYFQATGAVSAAGTMSFESNLILATRIRIYRLQTPEQQRFARA